MRKRCPDKQMIIQPEATFLSLRFLAFFARQNNNNQMNKKCMILLFLTLSFLSVNSRPALFPEGEEEIVTRKYCYVGLTGYQQSLFEGFISSEFPGWKTVNQVLTDQASLRNVTRLAQALLFRNKPGDKENAVEILKWVLKNQHKDEKSENYGMWKTNVANDRLDKNWREFIGCDLIILYNEYQELLPAQLLSDIKDGLIRAAKGALKRDVGADYTNISIMSAFLMDYVGTSFQIEELKAGGLKKALEIQNLFQRHQTFSEYNSPTYDGVTLIGLALWRELASDPLQKMGRELEKSLWYEIAGNYHPALKNMVGPYFRGYGMDMTKYYSITGIWIAVALDQVKLAPIPLGSGEKEQEMSNISPLLHVGLSIPKSALSRLKEFSSADTISRQIPSKMAGDTLKQVSAILTPDWMMGALWGNRRSWNQIKSGTIHWKNRSGEIEWLLVPGEGTTNVRISKTGMQIFRADKKCTAFSVYLYAKDLSEQNFTNKLWKFPSMELTVRSGLKRNYRKITDHATLYNECAISENYPAVMKITFQIPAFWKNEEQLLEISPSNSF